MITLDDFNYHLPQHLIARYPRPNRRDSRLLYISQEKKRYHYSFADFPKLLKPNDLLIFNDSRVMNARMFGFKVTGGRVELLIERIIDPHCAWVHIKSSRSPKVGTRLLLSKKTALRQRCDDVFDVTVIDRLNELFLLRFQIPLLKVLDAIGHLPIPPYFQRQATTIDDERYQTVYAKPLDTLLSGSVAAPTAGLHFDRDMLEEIQTVLGINIAFVTLHVGSGTFQSLRHHCIKDNHLHHEWMNVSSEVCEKIKMTKNKSGRVIAIGTTSVRCLETANGQPYCGDTSLFIYPSYCFRIVDALLTNFHLPKSSLLLLIAAFAGSDHVKKAYKEAIHHHYRFYSYGDVMFIEK